MRRNAFTYEEKVTIVTEHEVSHKTLKAICEEYDISKSYLCYLLKEYQKSGKESLRDTRYYSEEYKLKVIKRHFEDGIGIADLTRETGIQYGMLKQWLSDYQHKGLDGLSKKKRGRPRKPEPSTPAERMRQLEMENEVLQAFREECERWDARKFDIE